MDELNSNVGCADDHILVDENYNNGGSSLHVCRNCHRQQLRRRDTDGDFEAYVVRLRRVATEELYFRMRWKSFDRQQLGSCTTHVLLCKQCCEILTKEAAERRKATKSKLSWESIWPIYVWKMLSHDRMMLEVGGRALHLIPREWHKYWIRSLVHLMPCVYSNEMIIVSNECDTFVTRDVTNDRNDFKACIDSLKLGRLKAGCDKYLYPRVLCPWGCAGYIHHEGLVSFDAVVSRYFPWLDFAGALCGKANFEKLSSSREDYFSDLIDAWCYNPDWSVHPSVVYIPGQGPQFMTCIDHHRGTREVYFHLPKSGLCLPTKNAESLSHAVLRARTLRTTQVHKYTHSYQLNNCVASYNGIDTCVVSQSRRFDFVSHLTDVSEARAYSGRDDIRGLVAQLVRSGVLPEQFATNIEKRSEELFHDREKSKKLAEGGTMMTLNDCVRLQKMISSSTTIEVEDVSYNDNDDRVVKKIVFRRHWPSNLIRVHPNNPYGCSPSVVGLNRGADQGVDIRCFWLMANMMSNVPSIWDEISLSVRSTEQWQGFMLSYICRSVLNHSGQTKRKDNPFFRSTRDDKMKPLGLFRLMDVFVERHYGFGLSSGFSSVDLKYLLRDEVSRKAIHFLEMPVREQRAGSETGIGFLFDDVTCDSNIVMMLGINEKFLCDKIERPNGTFELRFVGRTWGCDTKGKWNGQIKTRHGSTCFPSWWCYGTTGRPWQKRENASATQTNRADVAVYIRCSGISVDEYKKDYLAYIGGQNRCICATHNVPLITSKSKKGVDALYCTHVSTKKEYLEFQCPVDNCHVGLCKSCFSNASEEATTLVDSIAHNNHTLRLRTLQEDGNVENDLMCEDSDGSIGNVGALATGEENPIFDICHAAGDDSDEFIDDDYTPYEGLISTTHAAATPHHFDSTIGTMGTSVLLNKCGTMLVRRDSRMKASRRERHFIERVISSSHTGTVPLVYLEGVLFPSIFWCLPHSTTGGILGSMPMSLFCQHNTRRQFNIASVADHAKTRLKSIGTTANTDGRCLSFQFDSLANGALEGQDTRVVLSRGFEECMGPAGIKMRNSEDDFVTDQIDSRQNVHNLCASERDAPSTLFVTLTCNQREHFGIRSVKRYIDDGAALDNYKKHRKKWFPDELDLTAHEEQEVQASFVEASRSLICRNWLEVKTMILRYILKSDEQPFGKVIKIFSRDEYQNDCGNLCHLHMLITLEKSYDTEEGRKFIQSIIRGYVEEIVGLDEVEQFIEEGLIEDWADFETMKEQARTILVHKCTRRCMRRTGVGEQDLNCRVPDSRKVSTDLTNFFQLNLDIQHEAAAVHTMERLGLCKRLDETGGVFEPIEDFLKAKRIFPAARHGEGLISPVVGRLFAATRSSMNVQICTSFGTSRYIVKYLIKIDENNYVAFHVKQGDESTLKAEQVFLHNTKITSSAINEKKRMQQSRHRKRPKGRALSTTEMTQIILGYPQIFCNMEFVKVATLPLGEHPGIERITPQEKARQAKVSQRDSFDFINPIVAARQELFFPHQQNRCVTASQTIILEDQMSSKVSIDQVSVFGLRPPELLSIDKMEMYFRYFERTKTPILDKKTSTRDFLSKDITKSLWIDCLGHQVTLRAAAAKELLQRIQIGFLFPSNHIRQKPIKQLLIKLCKFQLDSEADQLLRVEKKEWNNLRAAFVSGKPSDYLPIVVFSNVRPKNTSKFIIHLLLSMGRFETESDLWLSGSMRKAFEKAQLIPIRESNCGRLEDANSVLRNWIKDQLRYYPIGNKKFDEYVVCADNILRAVITEDRIPIDELPPYLYTSIVSNTNEETIRYREECKEILIDATLQSLERVYGDEGMRDFCPTRDQIKTATKARPAPCEPYFPRSDRQSTGSFNEQKAIQKQAAACIDQYKSASKTAT